MRKNVCIIIVFLLLFFSSCGDSCRVLRISEPLLQNSEQDLDCNLYLKGDKYWLELESTEDNHIFCQTISQGKVERKKQKVFLTDDFNGFASILSWHCRGLEVIHSFPFLRGKHFSLEKEKSIDIEWINDETNYDKRKIPNSVSVSSKSTTLLRTGCYKSIEGIFFNYKLILNNNHNYQLYIYNLLFSEGIWSKEGSLLKLFISENSNPYYLFIDDNKLVSSILPGCSLPDSFVILYHEDVSWEEIEKDYEKWEKILPNSVQADIQSRCLE